MFNKDSFFSKYFSSYSPYSLNRTDKIVAGVIAVFALIFYMVHLTPSVSAGDNGELTSAVYYLGVAHAPGYPIHTFFAKIFTFLPFKNIAWRVNLFSAFCGALTIFFACLVYIKLLSSISNKKTYVFISAIVGSVVFTMSKTLWSQSVTTEVYTVSSIFHPLMLYVLLKWQGEMMAQQNGGLFLGERYLMVFALLLGVGLGGHQTIMIPQLFTVVFILVFLLAFQVYNRPNYRLYVKDYFLHLVVVLLVMAVAWGAYFYYIVRYQSNLFVNQYSNLKPGITLFVVCYVGLLFFYLYYRWFSRVNAKNSLYLRLSLLSVKFFGMVFLGFTIYFYLFIRAHGNPPLNWGGINELEGFWGKMAKFFTVINRKQFPQNPLPVSFFNLLTQLKLFFSKVTYSQYSLPFLVIALLGLYTLFRHCKMWFYLFLFSFFSYIVFLTIYIKFDFNNQDLFFIEVFYIYAYFILSIFITLGVYFIFTVNEKVLEKLFLDKKTKVKVEPVSPKTDTGN